MQDEKIVPCGTPADDVTITSVDDTTHHVQSLSKSLNTAEKI
mgnify:CR=1 FL=1